MRPFSKADHSTSEATTVLTRWFEGEFQRATFRPDPVAIRAINLNKLHSFGASSGGVRGSGAIGGLEQLRWVQRVRVHARNTTPSQESDVLIKFQ
jgi:hypothetical protein